MLNSQLLIDKPLTNEVVYHFIGDKPPMKKYSLEEIQYFGCCGRWWILAVSRLKTQILLRNPRTGHYFQSSKNNLQIILFSIHTDFQTNDGRGGRHGWSSLSESWICVIQRYSFIHLKQIGIWGRDMKWCFIVQSQISTRIRNWTKISKYSLVSMQDWFC